MAIHSLIKSDGLKMIDGLKKSSAAERGVGLGRRRERNTQERLWIGDEFDDCKVSEAGFESEREIQHTTKTLQSQNS
jgi:hypothetical protein